MITNKIFSLLLNASTALLLNCIIHYIDCELLCCVKTKGA